MDLNEFQTRRKMIDVLLFEQGWDVSSRSRVINSPKFQVKNAVNSNSTQILDGLKKLSIISEFFDIRNKEDKVFFHSQEAAYGEGVFAVGMAKGFSSDTDFYRISPLKDILEIVPDKTTVIIEMAEQHIIKVTFSFSGISFNIFVAASVTED